MRLDLTQSRRGLTYFSRYNAFCYQRLVLLEQNTPTIRYVSADAYYSAAGGVYVILAS